MVKLVMNRSSLSKFCVQNVYKEKEGTLVPINYHFAYRDDKSVVSEKYYQHQLNKWYVSSKCIDVLLILQVI